MSIDPENSEVLQKYVNLILDEYIAYITWDDKLDSDSKAIRKKTVQSMRKFVFCIPIDQEEA